MLFLSMIFISASLCVFLSQRFTHRVCDASAAAGAAFAAAGARGYHGRYVAVQSALGYACVGCDE